MSFFQSTFVSVVTAATLLACDPRPRCQIGDEYDTTGDNGECYKSCVFSATWNTIYCIEHACQYPSNKKCRARYWRHDE